MTRPGHPGRSPAGDGTATDGTATETAGDEAATETAGDLAGGTGSDPPRDSDHPTARTVPPTAPTVHTAPPAADRTPRGTQRPAPRRSRRNRRSRRTRRAQPKARRRWSLRRRLVASCVALVAAVCAVIGAVTIFALHDFLYGQLDSKVQELAVRAAGPHRADPEIPGAQRKVGPLPSTRPDNFDPLNILVGGGQPGETVGAVLTASGTVGHAAVSATSSASTGLIADALSPAQAAAFTQVPLDGRPHTLHIAGLGDYRVESAHSDAGLTTLVGLSTAGAQDTLSTLVWVEVSVAGAGLAAAGLAGAALMRIALQPLRRLAATATRVSELPLHSGEVALHERVPATDADHRTEVGEVGVALNRMLGHVSSALNARQESETRVRRFVADASHELRTPLASIRGYAELTRRGRESIGPDTRHALGRIESEATRMTTLVEDLLLLARLDAGRPLDLAETDVSPLVVDAVSDARAVGHGHHWRLDLPDEPVTVNGDPQRLHQVLTNLLANARSHTPPGSTVTARVLRRGSSVLLQVEDDGPGIPPPLREQLFERFARGDASRSRSAGGTGLGLAIVRSVVTAHGGEVAVDSVPGRTVCTVTLPAALAQAVPRLATRS